MLSGAMVAEVLEPEAALRRISLLLVPVAVVDAAGAVVWTTGVGAGGEPQAARSTTRGITAEACIGAPSVKLGTVPRSAQPWRRCPQSHCRLMPTQGRQDQRMGAPVLPRLQSRCRPCQR